MRLDDVDKSTHLPGTALSSRSAYVCQGTSHLQSRHRARLILFCLLWPDSIHRGFELRNRLLSHVSARERLTSTRGLD